VRPSRPPTPPPEPPQGSKFGELILLERIAVGGMAEVFRAREPRKAGEDRIVALKRMLPHIAAEPGAARMFEAEAEIGRLVQHANVVRVHGVGTAENQPFLSLELVPGLDAWRFARWLEDKKEPFPLALAIFIARELCAALHAVHEARGPDGAPLGIVHGDVSPTNVLLSVHGDVKLADFGIAHARLCSSFPQAAAAGRMRGKLGYLSPEQVRDAARDRRADVFAAAVVAAELAIGQPLFVRETELSTLLAVRNTDVAPLAARASLLPEGLPEVLQRGLARDPAERFATAAEMQRALARFLGAPDASLRAELGALVRTASGHAPAIPQPITREQITYEPPLTDYRVRTADGRELGPWTFAHLVEAVTMGRLAPEDEVRFERGSYKPLASIEALAAHLPIARREPKSKSSGRAVELAAGEIVEALAASAGRKVSGVWVFQRGDARKEVYLVDGTPEFVTSSLPADLLGEFLVSRGVIQRGELDMALAVLPKFDGRLGDTLAALGLVDAMELFRHIQDQVREKLLDLFTWTEGQGRFSRGVSPPQRGFPLGLDPWQILLDGIERRLELGLEQDTFGQHLMDDLAPTRRERAGRLPGELDALMNVVSKRRPLQEVVEALSEGDPRGHRAYRVIRLALALRLVEWL
jgi:eukaryotic-like serine/threonine-protein kinase